MTLLTTIKNTIRRFRTPDNAALATDVKEVLANHDDHNPTALLKAYERAKRHGEIYVYPEDSGTVVKITDEQL